MMKNFREEVGDALLLLVRAAKEVPSLWRKPGRLMEQCFFMGNATMGLVVLLSFAIGAVLALQTGYSMQGLGVNNYIGSIVGLALVRELGPVMTAIMVVGRIGSATTAELASMRVYKEVDALTTMNIPPERLLVTPRLAAILVVMPFLTIMSIVAGWLGGALVSSNVSWIGLSFSSYFTTLTHFVSGHALTEGIIKGEFFGFSVVLISCMVGLRASGGPRQIGESVTKAVVVSIIYILFTDYFVTDVLLTLL